MDSFIWDQGEEKLKLRKNQPKLWKSRKDREAGPISLQARFILCQEMSSVRGDLAPSFANLSSCNKPPQSTVAYFAHKAAIWAGLSGDRASLLHVVSAPRWVLESSGGSLTGLSDWQLMLAVGWTSAGTVAGTWPLHVAARLPPGRVAGSQEWTSWEAQVETGWPFII